MREATIAGLAVAIVFAAVAAWAADYVGAANCRLCHKVQYNSWETLAHASAFKSLEPDDTGNPECLKCHATGASADLPGVQCEACHGPGSEYKSMKIMKDREASLAAGLILPDESTCNSCHVGEAPHELPTFDYAEALESGVHEHKAE